MRQRLPATRRRSTMPPPGRIAPSRATAPRSAPVFGRPEPEEVELPVVALPLPDDDVPVSALAPELEPEPLAEPLAPRPPPEAAAPRPTVPFMNGWGVQWRA